MLLSVDGGKAIESMGVATNAGIFVFGFSIFIEIYERSRSLDSWEVKRNVDNSSSSNNESGVALLFVSRFIESVMYKTVY